MKKQTTKRVALAVHVNAEDGYVSKLYSWILPEDIQGLKRGDILEVENLDATSEVVFIAEKNVSAEDYQGTKEVIKVLEYSLDGFFDGEWHSEIIKDFKNRIEVLARGITEHSYDHQEFRGGSLLDDWCELDTIYEKIEEVGGYKRSVKRIALCVYIDTRYNGVVSAFKEYPLAEDVQGLKTGDILTLNVMPEGRGELVFITEYEKNTAKQYEGKIIGVSNETLEETSFIYDSKEIKETLSLLAEGINSGLRATKEFSGYDLDRGWYSWDVEENEKIIEKRVAQKREELRKQRAEEDLQRIEEKKAEENRISSAIQVLKNNTLKLEELKYGKLYLMVQEDLDTLRLGNCSLYLNVGIFMLTENSRWELSPRFMLHDHLSINNDYRYGRESYKMFRLNREKEEGYHKNAPSIRQLHTDSTIYLDFAGFAERCVKTIEVRYGLGNSYKCPADTKDFATFGMLAHGGIERGQTELEFEVLNNKMCFKRLELSKNELNVLSSENGIDLYQTCNSKIFSHALIREIASHLKDDGECYTCQILKDGVWQTLGKTGEMVGSGCIKPYVFNASKNQTEFFDGKSYLICRSNCEAGIHFSKRYDETRIGYCPGEMAEW